MRQAILTDAAVRSEVPPKSGQAEIWDSRIRGFGVRISSGGTKSFILLYRYNGRPRRMTLGRYPTLSLADARKLANDALYKLSHGTDPGAEKVRERRMPAIENFDAFVDHFIETYARRKNRSADETARLLRREFVAVWRSRPLREISKQDVAAVLDRIMNAGKETTANRSLAAIRKLFNWAVERGHLDQSPCAGLRAPAKNVTRERVLTDEELVRVWRGAESMGYPYGPLVQVLILTAQRLNEVATMEWTDINDQIWTIPADRTKSARTHAIPLSPLPLRIIGTIPRIHEVLVFPARDRDRPVSGFGKWKRSLDEICGVSEWRIHDLRRTAATSMAKLGTPPHVVERILNHTSGTFAGVAGIYNRFEYRPEMNAAMTKHEEYLAQLLAANPAVDI